MELLLIFISAALVNNFVLSYFLGICPFIGVSNKTSSAISMGMATTFVMVLTSIVSWLLFNLILRSLQIRVFTDTFFHLSYCGTCSICRDGN